LKADIRKESHLTAIRRISRWWRVKYNTRNNASWVLQEKFWYPYWGAQRQIKDYKENIME
jgi:hypothetical protein